MEEAHPWSKANPQAGTMSHLLQDWLDETVVGGPGGVHPSPARIALAGGLISSQHLVQISDERGLFRREDSLLDLRIDLKRSETRLRRKKRKKQENYMKQSHGARISMR